jgi:hypothetical protein
MKFNQSGRKPDYLIPALLFVMIFLLAARTPLDTDLFWHMAAGRQTLLSGQAMVIDVFSFTREGLSWINHSWLSQAILYGLYQLGGNLALGAWVAGLATLSMGLVYAQMRGPAIFRAFLVVLAVTVAAVVWSPRPQLVSLVLFAFLGWVLHRYKRRKINQLWLLPVLFLAWSNLHGGWALGFMYIGVIIAGEILNHGLGNSSPEVLTWKELGKLVAWSAASIPLLMFQPNGFEIFKIPFQTLEVQVLQQFIQEWASPDFHELYQQPYLWLLSMVILSFGLSGRKVDASDLLTVIWFGIMGLLARRNFGPFALAVTPVLSRYLWIAFQTWKSGNEDRSGVWGTAPEDGFRYRYRPTWQKTVNLSLIGILTFAAVVKLWLVTYPVLVETTTAQSFPVEAVKILQQYQATGRVFNEYNWGGYLVWTIPQVKVFVDGRTDLYGDAILGEWIQIIQTAPGWQEKWENWQLNWALIEPTRPLVSALKNQGWKEIYRDDHAVLLSP